MASINYFEEKIKFKLPHPRKTAKWIKNAVEKENSNIDQINYIFCNDDYLAQINKQYLNHTSLTDIVTFDEGEPDALKGDIFISVERVKDNAKKFNVTFEDEIHRVMIHGVLHLIGYKDKTTRSRSIMRDKENTYLILR